MSSDVIRIALIGPESSGKTTLCIRLAEHFKTVWVPEFSRSYIANLNRRYTKEDILYCTQKQLESEDKLIHSANKFLFTDTELIVSKVWMLDVFNEYPKWFENKIEVRKYDLYLLTAPDLPFISDPVRENPHRRQFFYDWYKTELEKHDFNFEIINGEERFANAVKLIENLKI